MDEVMEQVKPLCWDAVLDSPIPLKVSYPSPATPALHPLPRLLPFLAEPVAVLLRSGIGLCCALCRAVPCTVLLW